MTDRELLELAAKVAGAAPKIDLSGQPTGIYDHPPEPGILRSNSGGWNPLVNDGDALRLAVHLRLMIVWDRWNDNDYVCIRHRDLNEEIGIQIDQSPEKTVRRAIVMAAAEIGRAM